MATQKKTRKEKAQEELQEALQEQYEKSEGVKREGKQIVIPERLSYEDAAEAILTHKEEMEEEVMTKVDLECHPHDGLVCFNNAVTDVFGNLVSTSTMSMFGKIPARTDTVPVGPHETETVPVGDVEVPGTDISAQLEVGSIHNYDGGVGLRIIFEHRKKHQPLINDIEEAVKQELEENSIFQGMAIDSEYEFIDVEELNEEKIVYDPDTEEQLNASIFSPIEDTENVRELDVPLKRGILLEGPFGTGKTLTARLAAKRCVENDWTFIMVRPGDDFVPALEFAKKYEPACVFVEDVDVAVEGSDRDEDINEILESIDGLTTKDSEVMVIMTTNRIDAINRGMLRPGRLDSVIHMGELEGEVIVDLIENLAVDDDGNSLLAGSLEEERIIEAGEGLVPAFLDEAVQRAKMHAVARGKNQVILDTDDIVSAIKAIRPQYELMQEDPEEDEFTFRDLVEPAIEEVTEEKVLDLTEGPRNLAASQGYETPAAED